MKPFSCFGSWIADTMYFFQSSCDEVTVRKIEKVIPRVLSRKSIMTKEEIIKGVRNRFNLPKEDNLPKMTRRQFNRQSLLEANVVIALINLQRKREIKMLIGGGSGESKICYSRITKL